ncbi:MAG: phytoene/squalene synthase family protein [Candidatus Caenarcaniphilales bacterium]|nr:phytoene/squalene synthase family protein [Candidatus Caenarcaniphilales bacterium]
MNCEIQDLEQLIKEHSKSFHFASSFLPEKKKKAIWSLYAFCRTTDDLVDAPHPNLLLKEKEEKLKLIDEWRQDFHSLRPKNFVLQNFQNTLEEFKIPEKYAYELIDGCRRDLIQNRYETFAQLSEYCYQVASTVGLMSSYIIGFNKNFEKVVVDNAIKAGIALQLTNIIRDVKEDLERDRIYLPKEDFETFNCDYNSPSTWRGSKEFNELIKFQVSRAHDLYKTSQKGTKHLEPEGRFAINCALTVYEGILDEVVKRNYDVFSQRAFVPFGRKLSMLPLILLKSFI